MIWITLLCQICQGGRGHWAENCAGPLCYNVLLFVDPKDMRTLISFYLGIQLVVAVSKDFHL